MKYQKAIENYGQKDLMITNWDTQLHSSAIECMPTCYLRTELLIQRNYVFFLKIRKKIEKKKERINLAVYSGKKVVAVVRQTLESDYVKCQSKKTKIC